MPPVPGEMPTAEGAHPVDIPAPDQPPLLMEVYRLEITSQMTRNRDHGLQRDGGLQSCAQGAWNQRLEVLQPDGLPHQRLGSCMARAWPTAHMGSLSAHPGVVEDRGYSAWCGGRCEDPATPGQLRARRRPSAGVESLCLRSSADLRVQGRPQLNLSLSERREPAITGVTAPTIAGAIPGAVCLSLSNPQDHHQHQQPSRRLGGADAKFEPEAVSQLGPLSAISPMVARGCTRPQGQVQPDSPIGPSLC